MNRFIDISPDYLKSIKHENINTPSLYYHNNFFIREFFWSRLKIINSLLNKIDIKNLHCLDFGGGSGVFLPTLSARFQYVTCIDLDTRDAQFLTKDFQLNNVSIIEGSVEFLDPINKFNVVIAADVLEHFYDLDMPINKIKSCLDKNGFLLTSLPTENWLYELLRKVFRMRKPDDHYHTSQQVENYLYKLGFKRVKNIMVPWKFISLFSISAWKFNE